MIRYRQMNQNRGVQNFRVTAKSKKTKSLDHTLHEMDQPWYSEDYLLYLIKEPHNIKGQSGCRIPLWSQGSSTAKRGNNKLLAHSSEERHEDHMFITSHNSQ